MTGYNNTGLQQGTSPSHFQSGSGEVVLVGNDLLRDKPQYLTELFQTYNETTPWLYKVKSLGFSRSVQGPETGHYEEPRKTNTFTIHIVTAPGAPTVNKTMLCSVDAADMVSYTNINGNTILGSRPRAGEVFMTADKKLFRIESKDETQNPHQFVAKPAFTGNDTTVSIVDGNKVFLVGVFKAEATGQPNPLTERYFKYVNSFAILKETKVFSGTYLTTASPFAPVKGKPGFFYVKGIQQVTVDHEKQKSQACLFGTPFGNLSETSQLGPNTLVNGTDGLVYFATTYGFDDGYGTLADYDVDDFYAMSTYYEQRRVSGKDIVMMQGYNISNRQDIVLKDLLDGTYVDYTAQKYMGRLLQASGMSPEKMFYTLGFSGFRIGGFNYLKMMVDEFNDIQGAGIFDFGSWNIAVPMGFFRNKQKDETLPIMGYEYRGRAGYSRENEIWRNGGAGDDSVVKSSDLDVANWYFRSEIATHFSHGTWFFVQKPGA